MCMHKFEAVGLIDKFCCSCGSLKNKTPRELILSEGYTTLERTTDWD